MYFQLRMAIIKAVLPANKPESMTDSPYEGRKKGKNMKFKNVKIGVAFTGSFCTFSKVMKEIDNLKEKGAELVPIMSEMVWNTDTRFGKAEDFVSEIEKMTGKTVFVFFS